MEFAEYKTLRKQGTIAAGINESTALRLVDCLPKRYQYAHIFWSWVWMLSIPGFVCVAIFYKWWVGLLLLLVVTPMIFKATKTSASQFVLEHAENDEQFFNTLVANDVLVFRPTRK